MRRKEDVYKRQEQSYIPFNIDKTATSDVWSNIYKLVLPNIPEKLFRYRRIDVYKRQALGQICRAAYRWNRHNYQLNIATMYIETNKKNNRLAN